METKEKKTEEQKETKRRSMPSFGEIVVESVWNAITWLPVLIISKIVDDN